MNIHPTAVVEDGAVLGADVQVGPYSIIGPQVRVGAGTRIDSHVVLGGNTVIGERNTIFPFASIGAAPQDLKFAGEESELRIGNENIIREYVTMQPGTTGGGMKTVVRDGNLFMASTHVGHDCIVGSHNIFANSAALSGHVIVEEGVTVGGLSGIHQFVRLGSHSFIGGGAMVVQDVPPYCLAQGDRAYLFGLNLVGLRRKGFSPDEIRELKGCYRELFVKPGRMKEKIAQARNRKEASGGVGETIEKLLRFLEASERGITSARQESSRSDAGAVSDGAASDGE
ncbi:acyl-ACP--UDP-N-acetylglucosamine O-acyltransferase [bacterium]|nr:acyl-ACP--UDP-N-acetylglucosamine O-acyltransferase [bacterium]